MTIRGFRILFTLLKPGKICQAAFACAFIFLSVMASMAFARPQSPQALPDQLSSAPGVPFDKLADVIVRNCAGCHFKGAPAARAIALDELISSPARSVREETVWRRVYSKVVVSRSMPPPDSGIGLSDDDRSVIQNWIDDVFRRPVAPERPTLRRLTNYEYNRSIRDLFGFDFDVEGYIQKDNASEGFTNNTVVMFSTADRARQYFAAARFVAETALGVNGALRYREHRWSARDILAQNPNRGRWTAFGRWLQDRLTRVK